MSITAPAAGEDLDSDWTDGVTSVANGFYQSTEVSANADLTLTTSEQDVSGLTKTFTIAGNNAYADVVVNLDFNVGTASSGTNLVGRLNTDSVSDTIHPINCPAGALGSFTVSRTFRVPLTTGSHTIKVVGFRAVGPAGTIYGGTSGHPFSTMQITVFDLP